MEIYSTEDIARFVTERTGLPCTRDKVRAALRKSDVGQLMGTTRVITADELEKAIEVVAGSRRGNPNLSEQNKTLKPRKKR